MRSLIIIEVEHGEDTDRLQNMIDHVMTEYSQGMENSYPGRPIATDYAVRVDLPSCFTLDKGE